MIFPEIYKRFVYLEKWQLASTLANHLVIRYYIARIWGLMTIVFANSYFNLLGFNMQSLIFIGGDVLKVNTHGCPGTFNINLNAANTSFSSLVRIDKAFYSDCAEDETIINVLFYAIADIIIRKLYELIAFSFQYCFSKKRKQGISYKWPYRTLKASADFFICFLTFNIIIVFFPYFTVLIPLLLFLEYKYNIFKLTKLREKPIQFNLEQENGYMTMILFNIAMILLVCFHVIFYITMMPHNNRAEVIYIFTFIFKLYSVLIHHKEIK
jgi:hypothetical protein